jgi:hypothetical protein
MQVMGLWIVMGDRPSAWWQLFIVAADVAGFFIVIAVVARWLVGSLSASQYCEIPVIVVCSVGSVSRWVTIAVAGLPLFAVCHCQFVIAGLPAGWLLPTSSLLSSQVIVILTGGGGGGRRLQVEGSIWR